VKDGADHVVEIIWNSGPATLSVVYDGSARVTYTLPSGWQTSIFGGNTNVYYGWTAGTGGSFNNMQVDQSSPNPASGACANTPTPHPSPVIAMTIVPCVSPVIPTFTPAAPTNTFTPLPPPTDTPTPYPTVCGALPAFVKSQILNSSGCTGSGNPTTWPFTVPAGAGQVMIVNVETGGGGTISGITFNSLAMTPVPSNSSVAITGGGTLYTYYMVNPPAGTFTLAPTGINGCSWNVVATLYSNVNTASPIGAVSTHSGSSTTVAESLATLVGYSVVHDFFAIQSGPSSYTGTYGTPLFTAGTGNCCDNVFGSYSSTTSPGTYNNNYIPGSSHPWTGVSVELEPSNSCGTPSNTPTYTVTPTLSSTPSQTSTKTQTSTLTASPSSTSTLTATPTKSPSNSPGPSPTFSDSPTPSDTVTLTPTPTASPTVTQSNTFTSTATPTNSATQSNTFTPTPSFSASPSVSATHTPTITRTATPSASPTPTATGTPSITGTFTISPTPTQSPLPVPYQLNISAYNSAGELVATIFSGGAQYVPLTLSLSEGVASTSVPGGVWVNIPGALTQNNVQTSNGVPWDLKNNTGQFVSSGVYYIKAEFKDPYDKVTSLTQPLQVINDSTSNTFKIFNSAGELVYTYSLQSLGLPNPPVTSLSLPQGQNVYAEVIGANGVNTTPLSIGVRDSQGNSGTILWYGQGSDGQPLQTGTYFLQVWNSGPNGETEQVSKEIMILKSGNSVSLSGAYTYPNPAQNVKTLLVKYPASAGLLGQGMLFDLSGNLVASGSDPAATGTFGIPIKHLASGIYLLRLRKLENGQALAERVLKVAVIQ
jgi:hypothetical protein